MERVYRSVADGCMKLQEKLGTYDKDRMPIYLQKEDEIKQILAEAPSYGQIVNIIANIGLDINEFYTFYGNEKLDDAITYAKDLKDRYTVLWMYYDILGDEKI